MFSRADGDQTGLQVCCSPFQEQVVGFAPAAGEHHFGRVGIDRRRYPLPCFIDSLAGLAAILVPARRVAEPAFEPGQHGGQDSRIQRRRGIVVEVGGAEHGRTQTAAESLSRPARARGCGPRRR